MEKILTVLVPVYNTEKYIKRCLDSVLLNEVLDDIEVLVVSDGSKDGAVDIVKEYMKVFPNTLRLIEKENGGHGSTINKGMEVAVGKYFKVLDSDDWVNCIDFIKFVKTLKSQDADIVVTNYCQEHIYSQSKVVYKYEDLTDGEVYDFDTMDLELLKKEYFVMATSTYKLDVLKKSNLHLLEKTFYVDMQYNIEPVINVKTIAYFDLDIYRYYIGRKDQSVNSASFVRNKSSHEKVMKYLLEYYSEIKDKLSDNKKEYLEMILVYMLNTHYTVYCKYDSNNKESGKQIKEFDDYFKALNPDLYNESNKIAMIRIHRKFNFYFASHFSNFFGKLFIVLQKFNSRFKKTA